MKKRILGVVLIICCLLSLGGQCLASFTDIPNLYWAQYYIDVTTMMGIVDGYPDGTFKPENKVTTGEFIKMCVVALNENSHDYSDYVAEEGEHWSMKYLKLTDGLFVNASLYSYEKLDSVISRGDMAVLVQRLNLLRHEEGKQYDKTLKYLQQMTDNSSIPDNQKQAVNYCIEFGIINGFEDSTFRASDGLTRAQATKVIFLGLYN